MAETSGRAMLQRQQRNNVLPGPPSKGLPGKSGFRMTQPQSPYSGVQTDFIDTLEHLAERAEEVFPRATDHGAYLNSAHWNTLALCEIIKTRLDNLYVRDDGFGSEILDRGKILLNKIAEQTKRYFSSMHGHPPAFAEIDERLRRYQPERSTTAYHRDGIAARRKIVRMVLRRLMDASCVLPERIETVNELFKVLHDDKPRFILRFESGSWTVLLPKLDAAAANGDWRAETYRYVVQFIMGMAQCLSRRFSGRDVEIWNQIVPGTHRR